MRKSDIVAFFGGKQRDVVRALKVSKGAVSQWPEEEVPEVVALRCHYLTEGELEYNPLAYNSVTKEQLALFFQKRDELALDPNE